VQEAMRRAARGKRPRLPRPARQGRAPGGASHGLTTTRKESSLNKTTKAALAATESMLALPVAASAHVSLHPNVLPAGDFPTVDIRVPNETDNARTVRVD